jgi:hypothetical protein
LSEGADGTDFATDVAPIESGADGTGGNTDPGADGSKGGDGADGEPGSREDSSEN